MTGLSGALALLPAPPPRARWDPGPGRPQLALAGTSPKVWENMGASPLQPRPPV